MTSIYSPIIVSAKSSTEDIATMDTKEFLTAKEHCEMFLTHFESDEKVDFSDRENYYEDSAKILDYLILSGDFKMFKIYCKIFNSSDLKKILNLPYYSNYFGSRLHTLLYHATGKEALEMYIYLRENGAEPFKNYYGELPYNQGGIYWTTFPKKFSRNPEEFAETYQMIKNYELGLKQKNQVICYCDYHTDYYSDYYSDFSDSE